MSLPRFDHTHNILLKLLSKVSKNGFGDLLVVVTKKNWKAELNKENQARSTRKYKYVGGGQWGEFYISTLSR